MATLHIQAQVINVGGGIYRAEVILKDQSGAIIDQNESDSFEVSSSEIIQLDVLKPVIQLRGSGKNRE
jgi:hypothetical protein